MSSHRALHSRRWKPPITTDPKHGGWFDLLFEVSLRHCTRAYQGWHASLSNEAAATAATVLWAVSCSLVKTTSKLQRYPCKPGFELVKIFGARAYATTTLNFRVDQYCLAYHGELNCQAHF